MPSRQCLESKDGNHGKASQGDGPVRFAPDLVVRSAGPATRDVFHQQGYSGAQLVSPRLAPGKATIVIATINS